MADIKDITPYNSDENSKKSQVQGMFDKIAPNYDFLNRFLTLGIDVTWRKKAIAQLNGLPADKVLDVATGTADLAIEEAHKLPVKSIIGMDLSPQMLSIGETKVKKDGLQNVISLETGDSENLRFSDDEFDIITAGFGVRNFENLEKGLKEMYRVLKPGGTMMILEFSKPRVFPLKQLFNIYFSSILPLIGKLKSKDNRAYKYLYESVQAFPDYDDFTNILKNIGFKNTKWKALSFGICSIYTAQK
ncbi:MAG TPA: bifunctional demethylmenaquinone methyltransferase/2-methoxy-6-polyprenyl-1,4-benzoquinol methylase UbiE [Saprospiraceae bacterium]|nr:bifunctional demethylmenaquinone methyltransferase/2-methoxy-6-polyprenyl-1,4-benzoquinol methylase UbiE [Saprospiraceae bacterium]